jgi:hypothetical protein
LTGREVLHAKGPMAGSGTIRVSNLAPGDYIARLEGLGQQAKGMIVKY